MLDQITKDNLWVVTDFDRTLTIWWWETAFSVFKSCPSIPEWLKEAQKGSYLKYRPIEVDLWMDPEERNKHMQDWHKEAMDAFHKYLTEERLQDAIKYAQDHIKLRDGMLDFTHRMSDLWIPLIVSSAWVSNVIEWVLEHNWVLHRGIHGNSLKFDSQGRFIWLHNESPVHNDDKNWWALPQYLIDAFSDRTHFLILWDAVWDIKMWPTDRITHNVWFLLWYQKWHETEFRNTFDRVIESDDCDRGFLKEVSSKLTS